MNQQFDLDSVLLQLADSKGKSNWTIRDSVNGLQIFGGIGSGKTSGSGRLIAHKFSERGFGGLVLTAKADEKQLWEHYCEETNRLNDLIIVEPGGPNTFNFLEYESRQKNGVQSYTENIFQVLKTVIRASEEKSGGKSDDPFWEASLDLLIFNVIDLCLLAYGKVTVQLMYNIVMTAPKRENSIAEKPKIESFHHAYNLAQKKIQSQLEALEGNLNAEQRNALDDPDEMEQFILENIPDALLLKTLSEFFLDHYKNLSEKTRSIIEFSFSGFLFRLLKEPVHSLFCKGVSTFQPEDCLNGKIILLNLPVKTYHKIGRDCQVMFKYIWQRAMEKRNIETNGRPVFLWADEAQHFIHEHDAEFQATARSSRIATVCLTQNLPNYHANMGGTKSEYRVKSFLGTLGTKIFHANADIETNKYASELIGDGYTEDQSATSTVSGNFSSSRTKSFRLERMVRPEEFVGLNSGGPLNNYEVEAYIHRQGSKFHNGFNHLKITFKQIDYSFKS